MTEEISSQRSRLERERLLRLSQKQESRKKAESIDPASPPADDNFRILVENSLDVIAVLKTDGGISYINPASKKVLGYEQYELLGRSIFELIDENDLPLVRDKISALIAGTDPETVIEARFLHKYEHWVFLEGVGRAFSIGQEPAGVLFNFRDITGRKAAEEEIVRRQDYYMSLVRQSSDMISILEEDLSIRWASPAMGYITGYRPNDAYGKSLFDFIHPDDWQGLKDAVEEARAEPDSSTPIEIRFRHKSDSYHYHEAVFVNRMQDPAINGFVVNSRDVTERRLVDDDLRKHREHLDELVEERTQDLEESHQQLRWEIAERKRAEEELKRSEAYYRDLVSNAMDMIIVLNEDMTMRYVGPSIQEPLGYDSGELVDESAFDFFHPEDIVLGLQTMRESFDKPGQGLKLELRVRHRDGSWHYLECIGRNLLNDPIMKGFVVSARDVTTRKLAENSLRDSEELYRTLVEEMEDVVLTWDTKGIIDFVSSSISGLSQYGPEDMIGHSVMEFLHPDDMPIAIQRMKEIIGGRVIEPREYRVFDKDGSLNVVRISASALWQDGEVTKLVAVMSDMTEKKLAELALKESEAKYRTLFEASADGICIIDESTEEIMDCNPAALRMFGYTANEMKGLKAFDLIAPETRAQAIKDLEQGLVHDNFSIEAAHVRKDGSVFPVEVVVGKAVLSEQTYKIAFMRDITARKLVEEALRENEEKFRLISEQSLMGLIIVQDDINKYVNKAAADIYELSAEEAQRIANFISYIHPEDREFVIDQVRRKQSGEGGQVNNYVHRIITKNGNHKWVEVYSKTVFLDGRPADLVTMADISDRIWMQEEIKQREAYFRSVIENSIDAVAILGNDGKLAFISQAVERILGYSVDEVMNLSRSDLIHPDDLEKATASLGDVRNRPGAHARASLRAKHKDGSYRDIEVSGTNLLDDPAVKGIVASIRDVTEPKRVRERMEMINHLFLSLGADLVLNMIKIVEACKDVMGVDLAAYSRIEKGKFSTLSTVEGEDSLFITDQPEDFIAHRIILSNREEPWIMSDVSSFPDAREDLFVLKYGFKSMVGYPVFEKKEAIGALCIFSETSREFGHQEIELLGMLARALSVEEERLSQEQSLKDFIDVASHELRHPITLMKGYALTLRDYGARLSEDARQEYLTIIGQGADRLDMLIKELLDVARIERGRFMLARHEVRLEPLLERAVGEMRGKGCSDRFNVSIPREMAPRRVDPEKLVRVLVVLLDNAVIHTPEGTTVEIIAQEKDRKALISVLDQGLGIPEKDRERIFDRFYQVEDALHHSAPGMGLGLYIAKEIVEAHGGRIWHEPREEGGSVFRFTIP
ncbi:MAG: hypothetical protein A2Y75_09565 [Candidatus Solincola sediminis]|uniref:histidine kinase n=1 Tax=Candidatus Solincola sediminis TaxID=1797199 RepID=A0A1F2WFC6_9ACTN|nr:MAG: hypothetical protein A2Y75_09565 [Candidatus Solincola sediminis]